MFDCLRNKEFIVTICWSIDIADLLDEGLNTYIDQLNEIGAAIVTNVEMVDKPKEKD